MVSATGRSRTGVVFPSGGCAHTPVRTPARLDAPLDARAKEPRADVCARVRTPRLASFAHPCLSAVGRRATPEGLAPKVSAKRVLARPLPLPVAATGNATATALASRNARR